jgi:hypothetical protein
MMLRPLYALPCGCISRCAGTVALSAASCDDSPGSSARQREPWRASHRVALRPESLTGCEPNR